MFFPFPVCVVAGPHHTERLPCACVFVCLLSHSSCFTVYLWHTPFHFLYGVRQQAARKQQQEILLGIVRLRAPRIQQVIILIVNIVIQFFVKHSHARAIYVLLWSYSRHTSLSCVSFILFYLQNLWPRLPRTILITSSTLSNSRIRTQ